MVISLVFTPPFLAVNHVKETAMAEPSRATRIKLVVAQFCRKKDHEIINEGAECVRSENTMQFSHHHQLATSLPLRSQFLGRCIAGQKVARLYIGWYGEF